MFEERRIAFSKRKEIGSEIAWRFNLK